MTKGLLIISLIIILLLMICPIIVTIVASSKEKDKKVFKKIISGVLIIDLIVIIMLLLCWISAIKNKDFTIKENTSGNDSKASSETTELSKAGFNEITIDEYLSLIASEEKSIILVARPTCYYCQQFTPILKQAMEDMNLTINYIDTDKFSSEDYSKFTESLDYIKNTEWGTPLTLIVQNGKTIDENNGYVELDKIKEFFTKNGYGE